MRSASGLFWSYVCLCLAAAGCDKAEPSCSRYNSCRDGYACNAEGRCQPADPLSIHTRLLPDAVVEQPYQALLEAAGGLPPYRWELQCPATWLQLYEQQGLLHGTPLEPAESLNLRVIVRDSSYPPGQTAELDLSLHVAGCEAGAWRVCYVSEEDRCLRGQQLCLSGRWNACENLTGSGGLEHCGPDCGVCDPMLTDNCLSGRCACGNQGACADPERCCAGDCALLETDLNHCGDCLTDCAQQVRNAEEIACLAGLCNYGRCQAGHYDCDGSRENGCEAPHGPDFCGGCDLRCPALPQTENRTCVANDEDWICTYDRCQDGWLDCHPDQAGCETARGVAHCADCEDACSSLGDGAVCLIDADEVWRCGCLDESDCRPDWLCCDLRCTDPGRPETCGNCDNDCTAQTGDRACIADGGAWRCGCNSDDDCAAETICCERSCVPYDLPAHCGRCDNDCALDPRGPRCMDPQEERCGCDRDWFCGEDQLCCQQVCVDLGPEHCGSCSLACRVDEGGPRCSISESRCYCLNDGDCATGVSSGWVCDKSHPMLTHALCKCPEAGVCAGNPQDDCCQLSDGGYACVNLETDPQNCGGCGVVCNVMGPDCAHGSCACGAMSDAACAALRTSDGCDIVSQRCECSNFSRSLFSTNSCTLGRYCCDGADGGEGAPGGGPDIGCCWEPCGTNEPGGCVTEE